MKHDEVSKIIEEIRPDIQMDGGDIEFIGVDESNGIVKIKFLAACVGCPMSTITLQAGISETLRQRLPDFKEVEVVES